MITPKHRVGYIDGLRAVAILSVVACHAAQYSTLSPNATIAFLFKQGSHGVNLFFVLSGFCLAYPTLERLRQKGNAAFDIPRYAARRVVRILPPYYAMILLLTIVAIVFWRLGVPFPSSMPAHGFTAIDVFKQMFFLDYNGLPHLLTRAFWTLQIEFRWYFAFPLLLFVWARSPKAFGLIIVATLVLAMTNAGSSDLNFLPAFMLGIVAAELQITKPRWALLALPAFILLLPYGVFGVAPIPGSHVWHLLSFLFVVAAGNIALLTRILSVRLITLVGLTSYSTYLVHEPVITFLEAHGSAALMAGIVSVLCGFGFWWVAERPFVETSVRTKLLSEVETVFAKWLQRFGIPASFRLEHSIVSREPATILEPHRFDVDLRHAQVK